MDNNNKQQLRGFLKQILENHGDNEAFTDEESLINTGRLNSISILGIVTYLENQYKINFSTVDFDVELFDSVNNIENLVNSFQNPTPPSA